MPDQSDILTVPEAAAYLRVSRLTVYRRLWQHVIPGIQVGREWHIRRVDLDAHVASNVKPQLGGRRKRGETAPGQHS
jgi:excisionase family DNA binding protein